MAGAVEKRVARTQGSDFGDGGADFVPALAPNGLSSSEVYKSSSRRHRTPLTLRISPFCSKRASHIAHYFEKPGEEQHKTVRANAGPAERANVD